MDEQQLVETHEEAHALGATILSGNTFVFPSKFIAEKFLYRHKASSTVTEDKDGKIRVVLNNLPKV